MRGARRKVLHVLLLDFTLVTGLLFIVGFIGAWNIQSLEDAEDRLIADQQKTTRLIDEIQHQQGSFSAVYYKLSDPSPDWGPGHLESEARRRILLRLDQAEKSVDRIVADAADSVGQPLWRELRAASATFSAEARRVLAVEHPSFIDTRHLFHLHEKVIETVAKLIEADYAEGKSAHQRLDSHSRKVITQSLWLVGGCLLFAIVCTFLTVRMTANLLRKMEEQADELSRVSCQMLEKQETIARRFSHELHDELGQSLTAVKARLASLIRTGPVREIDDCLELVDEAIRNIRELSHLLRPTILDELGLDAGLRWLAEGFALRTGIEVQYQSNVSGRLPDEMETHLFRIAQEATTNVARHSGASRVEIRLQARTQEVHLSITDNGKGLRSDAVPAARGLGIIGMRTRARGAGGELSVRSNPGRGVSIQVRIPAGVTADAQQTTTDLARR